MRTPPRDEEVIQHRLPPLRLPLLATILLACLSLLPRVNSSPWLAGSFWAATAVLVVLQLVLRRQVERTGRALAYEFVPRPVHYVQAMMQTCIYVYWGSYWREVYGHLPLVAGQLVFVYALDMLVVWLRRDKWVLGFGPFPIILGTNLFMWFRDDWFFLQFMLVATGVLGKEFVKWTRDGRVTHVFNPSTLSLSIFSIGLISTGGTGITWGPEISASLGLPPRIYLEIFLVGLVVQALFSVTLVTLSAAAALYAMNLAYTGATGTYQFIITNVPVAVFLGLHLLVTDPATSPRTTLGKIVFGGMYGATSFGLFGLLGWLGIPTFYDKILCVPALNLSVRWLDRASDALAARFRLLGEGRAWSPRRLNLASMAVWVSLFLAMMATGFFAHDHPGKDPAFWRRACDEGRWGGCRTWVTFLEASCRSAAAESCSTLGQLMNEGRIVARNPLEAGKHFVRACDLGLDRGCASLERFAGADGREVFQRACAGGDGASCFVLGELYYNGFGIPRDEASALDLFRRSCAGGWPRGCGRLGESYLLGEGTAVDPAKAIESLEQACRGNHATSCSAVGLVYRRGIGGPKNEGLAIERLRRACDLGFQAACQPGESPTVAPEIELLRLGG